MVIGTSGVDYMVATIAASGNTSGVFRASKASNSRTMQNNIRYQIAGFTVDDQWTAANLAIEAYNEETEAWDKIADATTGDVIEYKVANGKRTIVNPYDLVSVKECRFVSYTSGSPVTQANETQITVYVAKIVE